MRGNRAIVIAAAIAAVVIAVVLTTTGGGDGGGKKAGGGGSKPAAGAIRVSFAYSPEKETLLKPLIERFNREGVQADGRPVFVEGSVVSSGDAEASIAAGKLRPVAWSPASSLWGRLLNFEADREYVADDNPSIVRTPLVIAMWEPLARALGWPSKQVGFQQILDLALDPRGWATYGKPQFGRFKLGHTNPDFSTSGLSAVAAEYYAATGKREGLTEADIRKPKVRREIKAIERSIVHYGDTTLFFSDQLKRFGPAYASAVAMEEVTLVDFNRSRRGDKLVGLYPAEGTFFSDNPFIVLDAPWVSARSARAREAFQRWLAKEVTPERAVAQRLPPGRSRREGRRAGRRRARRRPRPADARALAPPAPRPRPDQGVVARGPQAGQRHARRRHVGLDERGGQARPGQAGTAALPAPARALRPRRAAHVQRPGRRRPSRSRRSRPTGRG